MAFCTIIGYNDIYCLVGILEHFFSYTFISQKIFVIQIFFIFFFLFRLKLLKNVCYSSSFKKPYIVYIYPSTYCTGISFCIFLDHILCVAEWNYICQNRCLFRYCYVKSNYLDRDKFYIRQVKNENVWNSLTEWYSDAGYVI